jgi:hypothetical protein
MPGVRVVAMGSSCKVGGAFSKGLVTPGKLSTNGFLIRRPVGIAYLIRLLQHTPSFKSSYAQPQSGCKEANEVTKWLRSLWSAFEPHRCSERLQATPLLPFNETPSPRSSTA